LALAASRSKHRRDSMGLEPRTVSGRMRLWLKRTGAKIRTAIAFSFLIVLAASMSSPLMVLAQAESAYDLINAVNALRAANGLAPYTIDPWLMSYAQEHSEYQARTHLSTHMHSDGTRPLDIGLEENVAGGTPGVVTASVIVYQIWADWGHRHILTGYATGEIGAGAALSDDGFAYYTVDVRTGEELPQTAAPYVGLETSTPAADGTVFHVVGEGQTLWDVAVSYGVTIDDLRRLNNLAGDSTVIQPGQKLLIRPAGASASSPGSSTQSTVTESPTATLASSSPTALSAQLVVPSPTIALPPTSASPSAPRNQARTVLMIALAVGIIGLSTAAAIGFWQAHADRIKESDELEGRRRGKPPPGDG
jgi:LysM repeat protein